MLMRCIEETKYVFEIINAMKFPKISNDIFEECGSLIEMKIIFENYFIRSLAQLSFDFNWDIMINYIKKRIHDPVNIPEVIMTVNEIIPNIFKAKIDWIAQRNLNVIYSVSKININDVNFDNAIRS